MNILALDNGSRSGWASEINGQRNSGVQCFGVHPGDTPGWRYIRFNVWLYKWREKNLDLVAYERPIPFHNSGASAEVAFGFSTRIEEFCSRHNIRRMLVSPSTLKKWATGNGRAKKPQMVKAAQILKPGIVDDNEADALWLLNFAVESLRRKAS